MVAPGDARMFAYLILGAMKEILYQVVHRETAYSEKEIVGGIYDFLDTAACVSTGLPIRIRRARPVRPAPTWLGGEGGSTTSPDHPDGRRRARLPWAHSSLRGQSRRALPGATRGMHVPSYRVAMQVYSIHLPHPRAT